MAVNFATKIVKIGIQLRILSNFSELNSENSFCYVREPAESRFFDGFRWFTD